MPRTATEQKEPRLSIRALEPEKTIPALRQLFSGADPLNGGPGRIAKLSSSAKKPMGSQGLIVASPRSMIFCKSRRCRIRQVEEAGPMFSREQTM